MNVGLQDALNLGWKLAAVVKGDAPDELLDTDLEERRPIGQILYTNTLSQVGLVTRFDPATLAVRETLNELLKIPAVSHRLAGELSGFDVAYGSDAKGGPYCRKVGGRGMRTKLRGKRTCGAQRQQVLAPSRHRVNAGITKGLVPHSASSAHCS
jgi:hypothetical protein